jgi:glucan phosphorylase
MKVLPNGGLNLSIRDDWWAEAFEEGVGWAFGTHAEGLTLLPKHADAHQPLDLPLARWEH